MALSCFCVNVHAQKKKKCNKEVDTLATAKEFMQVCNLYKKVPLQLYLEQHNTTNFITGQEDTANYKAEFYLQQDGSYVRFGEVEQLVEDSVAVLVSNKMQKMIFYPDAQPVLLQIKAMTNLQMKDSSVAALSKRYTSLKRSKENDTLVIELVSRDLLYGTSLPKERIELHYDARTKTPIQVLTKKRTLIPLEQSEYDILKRQAGEADKLLAIESKGYYLIKEQNTAFLYKTIGHEQQKLPVSIRERIVRGQHGEYHPAKGYEGYQVILN
jgi:hypothetical protein